MKNPFSLKKALRTIFIILLLILLSLAFSPSYISLSMDNLVFITALGIDVGENDVLKVSFQFANVSAISEDGSSKKSSSIINTVEAPSIDIALNLMNSYVGKKVNLSHCKLLIFSEEIARRGISKEVYTLMNDSQIRPSSNIVVSKCDAETYIKNSDPTFENLSTQYYEIFAQSNLYTGYVANSSIGNFFNGLICPSCASYAILGGLNSEEDSHYNITGKRDTENLGLAIFKEDRLVGELDAVETLCFSILKNTVKSFLISVPVPTDKQWRSFSNNISTSKNVSEISNYENLDLYLETSGGPKVSATLVNGSPYVTIDYKLNGKVYSMDSHSDYSDASTLQKISDSASRYLSNLVSQYLYKTSIDYKTDISGIGIKARSNFTSYNEMIDFDWNSSFQNSIFKVNIEVNVQSGSLLNTT